MKLRSSTHLSPFIEHAMRAVKSHLKIANNMDPDHNLDTCASLQNAIGYLWATELQPIDIKKKRKKSFQTKCTQTDELPQARTSD